MAKKISFYFDEMMPKPAADGLIARGFEVTRAVKVGMKEKDDQTEHLPFATERGMVLVTHDMEFAGLAAKRFDHAGVICWTGRLNDVGGLVRKLSEFAETHDAEAVKGLVFWIK